MAKINQFLTWLSAQRSLNTITAGIENTLNL